MRTSRVSRQKLHGMCSGAGSAHHVQGAELSVAVTAQRLCHISSEDGEVLCEPVEREAVRCRSNESWREGTVELGPQERILQEGSWVLGAHFATKLLLPDYSPLKRVTAKPTLDSLGMGTSEVLHRKH